MSLERWRGCKGGGRGDEMIKGVLSELPRFQTGVDLQVSILVSIDSSKRADSNDTNINHVTSLSINKSK